MIVERMLLNFSEIWQKIWQVWRFFMLNAAFSNTWSLECHCHWIVLNWSKWLEIGHKWALFFTSNQCAHEIIMKYSIHELLSDHLITITEIHCMPVTYRALGPFIYIFLIILTNSGQINQTGIFTVKRSHEWWSFISCD